MTIPKMSLRRFGIVAIVIILVSATAASAEAVTQAGPEPSFVVALEPDGSARVVVTITFDLGSDAERDAFLTLRDDETAREDVRVRFRDRMQSIASDAANATNREMAVTDPAVDLATTADNRTGIATLSVHWEGLAAVEDDRLVVTEPFASGFTSDRRFTLRAPEGYAVVEVTPAPPLGNETAATWNAGTDLDGFSVVVAPASTPTFTPTAESTETPTLSPAVPGEETGGSASGFGIVVGLLALLLVGAARARRSR